MEIFDFIVIHNKESPEKVSTDFFCTIVRYFTNFLLILHRE